MTQASDSQEKDTNILKFSDYHQTETSALLEDENDILTNFCPLELMGANLEPNKIENSSVLVELGALTEMLNDFNLRSEDITYLMAEDITSLMASGSDNPQSSDINVSSALSSNDSMTWNKNTVPYETTGYHWKKIKNMQPKLLDADIMKAWLEESSDDSLYFPWDEKESEKLLRQQDDDSGDSDMEEFKEIQNRKTFEYEKLESADEEMIHSDKVNYSKENVVATLLNELVNLVEFHSKIDTDVELGEKSPASLYLNEKFQDEHEKEKNIKTHDDSNLMKDQSYIPFARSVSEDRILIQNGIIKNKVSPMEPISENVEKILNSDDILETVLFKNELNNAPNRTNMTEKSCQIFNKLESLNADENGLESKSDEVDIKDDKVNITVRKPSDINHPLLDFATSSDNHTSNGLNLEGNKIKEVRNNNLNAHEIENNSSNNTMIESISNDDCSLKIAQSDAWQDITLDSNATKNSNWSDMKKPETSSFEDEGQTVDLQALLQTKIDTELLNCKLENMKVDDFSIYNKKDLYAAPNKMYVEDEKEHLLSMEVEKSVENQADEGENELETEPPELLQMATKDDSKPDLATALRFMTEVYYSKDEDELHSDTFSVPHSVDKVSFEEKIAANETEEANNYTKEPKQLSEVPAANWKPGTFEPTEPEEQRTVTRPRNKFSKFFKTVKQKLSTKKK